jgi:hypothetical protein
LVHRTEEEGKPGTGSGAGTGTSGTGAGLVGYYDRVDVLGLQAPGCRLQQVQGPFSSDCTSFSIARKEVICHREDFNFV